ncbi:MAG: DUF2232 domain-containing protein [Anaerovoracaceae bacterium]|jgi:uncharacterized protein YybS (DUF2232 family)
MYASLTVILILLLPIPVLAFGLRRGDAPYRVIVYGACAGALGAVAVFAAAQLAGSSLGAEIDSSIHRLAEQLSSSEQMAQMMDLTDAGHDKRVQTYESYYSKAADVLPATLLIFGLIVSWLEGLMLGKAIRRDGRPLNPVPPFRELTLPRHTIAAWFVILIIAWILKAARVSGGALLLDNVNMLFTFTFALQGMSLVFAFAYRKHIPRVVPLIVVIVLWFTSIGQIILFFAGIIDLAVGLRDRIKNRGTHGGGPH